MKIVVVKGNGKGLSIVRGSEEVEITLIILSLQFTGVRPISGGRFRDHFLRRSCVERKL